MAGTFPFVFVYQMIAAPFVAGFLVAAWGFWRILEPGTSTITENPFVIAVSIVAAILAFGTMLVMSLSGSYEGWRTGWAWAQGRRFQEALFEGPTVKVLFRFLQKARSAVSHLNLAVSHRH